MARKYIINDVFVTMLVSENGTSDEIGNELAEFVAKNPGAIILAVRRNKSDHNIILLWTYTEGYE